MSATDTNVTRATGRPNKSPLLAKDIKIERSAREAFNLQRILMLSNSADTASVADALKSLGFDSSEAAHITSKTILRSWQIQFIDRALREEAKREADPQHNPNGGIEADDCSLGKTL